MKIEIPLPCVPLSHQQNVKDYPKIAICPKCTHHFTPWEMKKHIFMHHGKHPRLAEYQVAITGLVYKEAKKLGFKSQKGSYSAEFIIYIPKDTYRPDVVNLIKPIEDACESVLFSDDANCEDLHVKIMHYDGPPKLEIQITSL